jgi:hypothetical protein
MAATMTMAVTGIAARAIAGMDTDMATIAAGGSAAPPRS